MFRVTGGSSEVLAGPARLDLKQGHVLRVRGGTPRWEQQKKVCGLSQGTEYKVVGGFYSLSSWGSSRLSNSELLICVSPVLFSTCELILSSHLPFVGGAIRHCLQMSPSLTSPSNAVALTASRHFLRPHLLPPCFVFLYSTFRIYLIVHDSSGCLFFLSVCFSGREAS